MPGPCNRSSRDFSSLFLLPSLSYCPRKTLRHMVYKLLKAESWQSNANQHMALSYQIQYDAGILKQQCGTPHRNWGMMCLLFLSVVSVLLEKRDPTDFQSP